MTPKVRALCDQIGALQAELLDALHEQEAGLLFRLRWQTVELEESAHQAHARLKTSFFHWLVTHRPRNLLTGPIIYSPIVPLVLLGLCVCLQQASCFPIYRMAKVRGGDYIAFDRHLQYLNSIEKFPCTYCAYANGVLAFASAVAARTEDYFCPVKHAQKVQGHHSNYEQFLDCGEAEDFTGKLEEVRCRLAETRPTDSP